MDHATHCGRLAQEVERFARLVEEVPADARVPGCPDWAVRDLTFHLGTVHRWAAGLVGALVQTRIGRSDDVVDPGPPSADWLRAGGTVLVGALRAVDPDTPMWAWGPDQHVRFWSRRQHHETLVHRIDAEMAGGRSSQVDPEVAADGIDEFLVNLGSAAAFSKGVANLRGTGERLALRPDDAGRSWTITLTDQGFTLDDGAVPAQATMHGPALDLLLVVYRRRSIDDSAVLVDGQRALADFWWEHSALT